MECFAIVRPRGPSSPITRESLLVLSGDQAIDNKNEFSNNCVCSAYIVLDKTSQDFSETVSGATPSAAPAGKGLLGRVDIYETAVNVRPMTGSRTIRSEALLFMGICGSSASSVRPGQWSSRLANACDAWPMMGKQWKVFTGLPGFAPRLRSGTLRYGHFLSEQACGCRSGCQMHFYHNRRNCQIPCF